MITSKSLRSQQEIFLKARVQKNRKKRFLDWRIRTTDLMIPMGKNSLQSPALPTELSRDSHESCRFRSLFIHNQKLS